MSELGKYGQAKTLLFPLIHRGSSDLNATPATHASGDTKISKDEGAFANTTNAFAHEGNGIYSLALDTTEMSAARISLIIVDQTDPKVWEDQVIILETYGNASAEHAFDLDTATQNVNVSTISNDAITAAAIATGAIDADAIAANAIGSSEIADGAITAAKIATDAIDADALADGAITAATFAAGAITATVIATDAIDADAIAANAIGASEIADGAITANKIATDAIDADALSADAIAEINATVDQALADYDGPTHAELVSEINSVQADIAALVIPNVGQIADAVWDESQAGHVGAGTFGLFLDVPVSTVGGGSLTEAGIADAVWDELIAGHLGAGSTGEALDNAGAAGVPPTADEVAEAVLLKPIADVELGSHIFRSLYGMIAKQTNRVKLNGASLEVYETDDTTVVETQTATTSASQDPVVELNTD